MIGLTSNARAVVTVVLEVPISDNWRKEATVEEIHKQGVESALMKLNQVISGGARLIGSPKVTMIMLDAKD